MVGALVYVPMPSRAGSEGTPCPCRRRVKPRVGITALSFGNVELRASCSKEEHFAQVCDKNLFSGADRCRCASFPLSGIISTSHISNHEDRECPEWLCLKSERKATLLYS